MIFGYFLYLYIMLVFFDFNVKGKLYLRNQKLYLNCVYVNKIYIVFFLKKKIYLECFFNIIQIGFFVCIWDLNYIKWNLSGLFDLIVFEKSNIYFKFL